ncbi:MarR family winged helix-turn-helix transcriptional regulator [Atopobium minutum]|uniref:MarR family winged helix-turn-helix transcriptional regulator n=1 Tax=Atopobium minutum TaxID=1381 RepID=UPI0025F181C5|nr:MarR family transcriptional regulator [Atopobium minutum]
MAQSIPSQQASASNQAVDTKRFETFSGLIFALHKEVQRFKKAEMARFGLQGTDASCLLCLHKYPKGIPSADIARALDVDRALVSRSLASLMQKGYAQTHDDQGQGAVGYRSPVFLTKKGMELACQVEEIITRMVGLAASELIQEDIVVMYRVLEEILDKTRML